MRQIRQALRLHLEAGLSYAQVARAVGTAKGTVGKFVLLARAAGVDWRGRADTQRRGARGAAVPPGGAARWNGATADEAIGSGVSAK